MGTPEFALPSLRAVARDHELTGILTQPDRPRGRGRRVEPSPVKRWAVEHGVKVLQPRTLRDSAAQAAVAALQPEVIVVAAYGLILPPPVLELPPHGCINVHASLLPRHRGAAPVARAILAGDRRTGITTMLMDEGLDTGPVLLQREVEIGPRQTTPELTARLARLGGEVLAETLPAWEAGELRRRPQDDTDATLAPRLRKEEGVVHWESAAVEIDRQVRALMPWPGTWTTLEGERLRLWWVEVADGAPGTVAPGTVASGDVAPGDVAPGTVLTAAEEGIHVACGAGSLWIRELQRPGGRRMEVGDYLRGHPLEPGVRLGG